MPAGGYAWWYIDGISDCGTKAVSVIAFIGSVFSPWYRWSGRGDPENHVCINVATYGRGGRFTMTDRGRAALDRGASHFTVGPSSLRWEGGKLVVEVNEWGAPPMVSPVRGRIVLTPQAVTGEEVRLSPDGAHLWRPFAPRCTIEVALTQGHEWQGHGYMDANFGSRPLEADFDFWTWGRFPLRDRAICAYDAVFRDGTRLDLAVEVDSHGHLSEIAAPPRVPFARSLWQVARETRADAGVVPKQRLAMLDAPFYARAAVETQLFGEKTVGVHEALDLRRLRMPVMPVMLACRVPRWTGKPVGQAGLRQ